MRVVILWVLLTVLVSALGLCACGRQECVDEKVAEVGGCDRQGKCGVIFESGRTATAEYPVKGQVVRLCSITTK